VRRIIIVGGVVVVLVAAFVIPAVAAPGNTFSPLGFVSNSVLPVFGFAPPDDFSPPNDPNFTDSAINSAPNGPGVSGPSSGGEEPFSTSSSSDPAVDPSGVSQQFSERRITSGSASPSSSFSNSGNNVNACPTTQQVTNTGNVANQQGVSQYNTETGDIDASGSSINITPSVTATCDQSLNQTTGG
jgi:hypothetical protein